MVSRGAQNIINNFGNAKQKRMLQAAQIADEGGDPSSYSPMIGPVNPALQADMKGSAFEGAFSENPDEQPRRDPRSYMLGRDPDYAADATARSRNIGGQGAAALIGQGAGAAAAGTRQAGMMNDFGVNMGQSVHQRGNAIAGRASPDTIARLAALEDTEGPSAAQATLREGANRSTSTALALGASGRGFGGGAAGTSEALRANAATMSGVSNQAAALRAQENSAFRQRQAANLGAASGLELGAQNQRDVNSLAHFNTGAGITQRGLEGAAQTDLTGRQTQIGATQAGVNAAFQGEAGAHVVNAAQANADQNYEQMITNEQAIRAGSQSNLLPAVVQGSATGVAVGAAAFSDERAKNVGQRMSASERLEHLTDRPKLSSPVTGNPYGRTGAPGMKMSDRRGKMVYSDERSKNKIADLEDQNDHLRDMVPTGPDAHPDFDTSMGKAAIAAKGQRPNLGGMAADGLQNMASTLAQPTYTGPAPGIMAPQQIDPFAMSDERNKRELSRLRDIEDRFKALTDGPSAAASIGARAGGDIPDFRQAPAFAYEYKDPSMPGAAPGVHVGPLAQDLERAGSSSVVDTQQGKMVDTSRLALETASGVGENSSEIDRLHQRLDALEDTKRQELDRAFSPSNRPRSARPKPKAKRAPASDDEAAPDDFRAAFASENDRLDRQKGSHRSEPVGRTIEEVDRLAMLTDERRAEDKRLGLVPGREGSAAGAFARSIIPHAVDTAALPVTLPARALRALGVDNDIADLSASEAFGEAEAHVRGKSNRQHRRDVVAEKSAHPIASQTGAVIGDTIGGLPMTALGGRAISGRATLPNARAEALGALTEAELGISPTAFMAGEGSNVARSAARVGVDEAAQAPAGVLEKAYAEDRKAGDREIAEASGAAALSGAAGAATKGAATRKAVPAARASKITEPEVNEFLNVERKVASDLQRLGFDAVAKKYGPARAKKAQSALDGTQAALERAGKEADSSTTVYRGMRVSPEEAKRYEPGNTLENDNIWSTSSSRKAAERFAALSDDGGEKLLLEIKERTAVPSDVIPGSNTFEELLIPAKRKLRVTGARRDKSGAKVVTLEELH